MITAMLEVLLEGKGLTGYVVAALPLVVSSTIIHQRYPYVPKAKTAWAVGLLYWDWSASYLIVTKAELIQTSGWNWV